MTVNGTDTYAVLHYEEAPDAEPTAPQPAGPPADGAFQEFNLKVHKSALHRPTSHVYLLTSLYCSRS